MTSPIPRPDDAVYGDDDKIIGDMSRIQQKLADRIDKIRSTANTTGLDPQLAEILHTRMQDTQTHLTSGSDIAQVNMDQARSRMAIADEHGSRVRGLNTSITTPGYGSAPLGSPGSSQAGHRTIPAGPTYTAPQAAPKPSSAQPTPSAAPQPATTHTSAGGSAPAAPAQPSPQINNRVPATAMRNGAYVPPVPAPMPDNYAANLAARNDQARQQALAAQQQRLQAQQAQREQARQAREQARQHELEKRQQARQLERAQAMEEMEREQEERQREHEEKRAKAEKNEKLQEVLKEWRNEVSQMDLDHQDEVLDKGSDAVSREEAVAIIEEALGDYYDEQDAADAAGGIDAVGADGGAYSGGGGLAPAGSIGMDVSEVSFDNVNMGTMDEATINAYIEDAMDLNGWTTDPEIRQQLRYCMYQQALHESGGNPNAANGSDSNAVGPMQYDGYPAQSSRGPWQTIPETFATYHVEGTSNSIYDPQASAAAALAYMMDRYGMDPQTGAGIAEFASSRGIDVNTGESTGAYHGY